MIEKTSMLYWFPKIKDIDIPQPKTDIMQVNATREAWVDFIDGKKDSLLEQSSFIEEVRSRAEKIGYPLFLRTDQASGKHGWKNTCYVESKENLIKNLKGVIEFSFMADIVGLPIDAVVFREYIPMKNLFTAFHGEMPVNPEIRFFVKDGEILCWHWYWIEDAIRNPSIENWKEIIEKEKDDLFEEVNNFVRMSAQKIAILFKDDGYWSVDFCKAKDGRWWLIDMADGFRSWHPENCEERLVK